MEMDIVHILLITSPIRTTKNTPRKAECLVLSHNSSKRGICSAVWWGLARPIFLTILFAYAI